MIREADAVVIGAGVAGSGMAYALAKRGWDVVLVDKTSFPRHKACGEFLSPESLSSLRALGLDGVVGSRRPALIEKARIHTEQGASLEVPLPGPALGISRYALDACLQAFAVEAGVRFFPGCGVSGAEPVAGDGGFRVDCGGPSSEKFSIRARIVIGAGGRRMGDEWRPPQLSAQNRTYVGIKSHFTRTDPSPVVDLFFFRGGYIGIAPVEGDRFNVAAIVSVSAYPKLQPAAAIELLLAQAAEKIPALSGRLAGAAPVPGTQAATYPLAIRPRPLAWSGMPLIGDAAAVIPPFCGDGMAMALRSAELCAPLADAYLRGDISLGDWRIAYARQLKRQFAGPLRWGSRLERLMRRPALASLLLRFGTLAPSLAGRIVRATRLRD